MLDNIDWVLEMSNKYVWNDLAIMLPGLQYIDRISKMKKQIDETKNTGPVYIIHENVKSENDLSEYLNSLNEVTMKIVCP